MPGLLTPDAGPDYVIQEQEAGRNPFRTGQRNAAGRVICGGKGKRRQAPCMQEIICTNGRCRMHNGKALQGIASPAYKHGRHSKYVPARLMARYGEGLQDPELLNLTEEISLVDARVTDLLSRVDTGESGARWKLLDSLRKEFLRAQRMEDQRIMASAMAEILNAIRQGRADFEAWAEIVDLLERRRRLVDTEQKRRVQMHLMVRVDDAVSAMQQIADTVRGAITEHIDDATIRRDILTDVQAGLDRYLASGVSSTSV